MFSHIKELFTRPSGYNIAKSVRLRSSASAYLNRTPASAGNRQKWTISFWTKRGKLSSYFSPIGISPSSANYFYFRFEADDTLSINEVVSSATNLTLTTTQVFRDPSAWYHIVLSSDTTQATASNRLILYVNGVQVSAFSTATYPSQNYNTWVNTANPTWIGCASTTGSPNNYFYDGYLTEINWIDGQQLTPSSFGETDVITGVWKAKKYGGTYGTNGFYLNFSDNSSNTATTIGKDYSGNGNNWTPNNISVTAGATYDSMVDSPTVSAVSSNYAVLNPLNKAYSTYTLSDGNLNWTSSTINMGSHGTFQLPTSGKYYWEIVMTANAGGSPAIGIADGLDSLGNKGIEYRTSGNKEQNGGVSGNGSGAYGATWTTNDVIGIAYDADTSSGQVTFYKNNSSQGVAYSSIQTNFPNGLFPSFQNNAAGTTTFQANFGQRPFTYTPPTGFVALNTYNLPASTIKNGAAYMAATTYTGTGATASISNSSNGVSFQPDWVWVKQRNGTAYHALFDSVRGATKVIQSNTTTAEQTFATALTAFNSDGFTTGSSTDTNQSGQSYIGWQWKAGGTSSSNTNGTITSTVSAGATQGFSVVTYTGTGANATVGHGLGVAPSFVIIKERGNVNGWLCYHISTGNTGYLELDDTGGFVTLSTVWNNTTPSSSVVTLGTVSNVNRNGGTFVAYCFSAVAGYSSAFSYTGNGSSDGPFVYLGFRPRWIMVKKSSNVSNWQVLDSSRSPYNLAGEDLLPNTSDAEKTIANGFNQVDMLSNGFKIRNTNCNDSGGTYIGFAFAESPFKTSLAR